MSEYKNTDTLDERNALAVRPAADKASRCGVSQSLPGMVLLVLALCTVTAAQAAINLRFYDTDRDGLISPAEYRVFLVRQLRLSITLLDTNDDGDISTEEIEALANVLQTTNERVEDYELHAPEGLELHDFAEHEGLLEATADPPANWLERQGLLVRGNLESMSLFADAKPLSAASSASVSYSRDYNDNQSWSTIKGVLMRPVRFETKPNLIFLPSLSLNRTRYSEPTASGTDTLILRAAIDRLYTFPDIDSLQSLNFRVNPAYITDSRFNTAIVSAEFQLQPSATRLGIGKSVPTREIQFQWLPNLFSEYGRVLRQEDVNEEKSRFFRIGPRIELELWFRRFQRLRATMSAQHLLSLRSESRSRKSVEVSLALALDNAGHLALQVRYVNGDSSAKLEDEHFWTLGLGIKY